MGSETGRDRIVSMKTRSWLLVGTAVASLLATSLRADDLFQLSWHGTYYAKDSSGHIVAVRFTEQDLVNQVAQNNGLDPSQLVFVYRPNKRDTAVVRSNGAFVATVFEMQFTFTD